MGYSHSIVSPLRNLLPHQNFGTTISTGTLTSSLGSFQLEDQSDNGLFTATVVPVPAAVWLFGSALGVLGWARRRPR